MADIDKMTPHSGRFLDENNQPVNIVTLLNGIIARFENYATIEYVDEAIASIPSGNNIEY